MRTRKKLMFLLLSLLIIFTTAITVQESSADVGNNPPTANPSSFTVAEGGTHNGAATATDVDGDPLTFALATGPAKGTLIFNANGDFTYTAHRQPTVGFVGSDSFTFIANDGQVNSEPATVNVTIVPINDAPVATPKSFTVNAGSTYDGQVTATDADGDAITFVLQSSPSHGTLLLESNGSFQYTAEAGYVGNDSFTISATDGLAYSGNAIVSITIESDSSLTMKPYATDVFITGSARVGQTLTGNYTYNANDFGDMEEGTYFRWLWVGAESTIYNNWNIGGVTHNINGPPNSTTFTIADAHIVTYVNNYHWNNSLPVGNISLVHEDGTVYGPWNATGSSGSGRTNVNWEVYPNELLKAGTYTVVDSAPATWSYNSSSSNKGFSLIKGYLEEPIPGADGQTYQLAAGDEGRHVAFEVKVRDDKGNLGNPVVSNQTEEIEEPLPISVDGVTLNFSALNLIVGGVTETLVATVEPEDAANKNLTWSSSDETVATVAANGGAVVTPVSEGTATITATTEDGGFSAECVVTVQAAIEPQYTISFNSNEGSSVDAITADNGTTLTEPTSPTREGYDFAGWYQEETLTNAWDFATDTVPAEDITLYAKWTLAESEESTEETESEQGNEETKSVEEDDIDEKVDEATEEVPNPKTGSSAGALPYAYLLLGIALLAVVAGVKYRKYNKAS